MIVLLTVRNRAAQLYTPLCRLQALVGNDAPLIVASPEACQAERQLPFKSHLNKR